MPKTVDELLDLQDTAFISAAYQGVLGRDPDPGGSSTYLRLLRLGTPKLEILSALRGSAEGASKPERLSGLDAAIARHRGHVHGWRRKLAEWLVPDLGRRTRVIEAQVFAMDAAHQRRLDRIERHLESLSRELRSVGSSVDGRLRDVSRALHDLRLTVGEPGRGDAGSASLVTDVPDTARVEAPAAVARVARAPAPLLRSASTEIGPHRVPASGGAPMRQPSSSAAPSFSIVMPVYKTPVELLARTVASVRAQTWTDWELCICDDGSQDSALRAALEAHAAADPRVRVVYSPSNGGISRATNRALEMARFEFVALLDHDDELTPDALESFAEVLAASEDIDAIYSDQETIDANGKVVHQFFKPDWSPEYFRRVMYVGHLLAVRTSLVRKLGGLDPAFDRVQDYELMLRVGEVARRVHHVPRVLYRWRAIEGSIAASSDAKGAIEALQCSAVAAHLARLGLSGIPVPHPKLPHRALIEPAPRKSHPRVSIVIPTKNHPEHIGRCLSSIYGLSTWPNLQVVVVDNGTTDNLALQHIRSHPVVHVAFDEPFNYSRANNLGVSRSDGEFVVLLNNDTEVLTRDWIERLVAPFEQGDVGATSPMLIYPSGLVQAAGVVIGPRGTADHVMRNFPADSDGYAGSLSCTREVTAATGACLVMRKSTYLQVGGLVEYFGTHYQDVDLCLRVRALGQRVVQVADARLVHHESASRGSHYDILDRLLLQDIWQPELNAGDPYFNPAFARDKLDYSLAVQTAAVP